MKRYYFTPISLEIENWITVRYWQESENTGILKNG